MPTWLSIAAGPALLAWLYLLLLRGRFWVCGERLADDTPALDRWPTVAAVVPARNEEDTIAAVLASLASQDYPGRLSVTLVDDRSVDATRVRAETVTISSPDRALTILTGEPLPTGWSGKLWAVHQGISHAIRAHGQVAFIFLSDADIVHAPETLRRLIGKAVAEKPAALVLTLPIAGLLYLGMTLDSARRHWWGSGSRWKGRDYGRQEATG